MNHKNELSPAQALARKEWIDSFEELRVYAYRCARRYCRTYLPMQSENTDYIQDVADDGLSEGYRDMLTKGVPSKRAIKNAIDRITDTAARHLEKEARDTLIGDIPEHTQQYETSQEQIEELLRALPKHVRPLALLLSTGHYHHTESKRSANGVYRGVPEIETTALSEILNRNKSNIKRQLQTLRKKLGSRFSYLLGDVMETPVQRRVRP